jgi:hypothetical protein
MGRAIVKRALIGAALGTAAVSLWRRTRQGQPAQAVEENDGLPTRDELYRQAQQLDIPGRSRMTKAQLALAVQARRDEVTSV